MKKMFGILCSCTAIMSYLAISPVIADIANAFPGANVSAVQMIITLPSLMSLIFSLLAGRLAKRFYKKTLIIISLCAILIGGMLPVFFHESLVFLLICSGIIGVGVGGMLTLTPAIICDYYTGEDRNRMMGFQSAAISGGAMVFSLIGGWLSNWGWSRAYLALLLLVPCLFAVILLMPKGIIEQEPEGENRQNHKQRRYLSSFIWFISIIGFVYYICQNTYNTNVSLFVEEAGLGTAQTTSIATSVYTFSGIFAGILLQPMMKIMKKYTMIFAIFISGLGLLFAYLAGSMPLVVLGGFLCGFGFSTFTPAGTCLVSDHATLSQRSMSIAIFSTFTNVGSSLSPIIINAVMGAAGIPGVRSKFIVTTIGLVIVLVITGLGCATEKEN